jgi:hypothetical protein
LVREGRENGRSVTSRILPQSNAPLNRSNCSHGRNVAGAHIDLAQRRERTAAEFLVMTPSSARELSE